MQLDIFCLHIKLHLKNGKSQDIIFFSTTLIFLIWFCFRQLVCPKQPYHAISLDYLINE